VDENGHHDFAEVLPAKGELSTNEEATFNKKRYRRAAALS
jgi:hypothetical protein